FAQAEPHLRAALAGEERNFDMQGAEGASYRVAAKPVVADGGAVIGCLVVGFDDTERRLTLAELERRLAQQSAVARLGELALEGVDPGILMHAGSQAVADALVLELAYVLEHEGDGRMTVRAGVGWDDGLVGSSFEMQSYGDEGRRNGYRRGPVVIEDLPG